MPSFAKQLMGDFGQRVVPRRGLVEVFERAKSGRQVMPSRVDSIDHLTSKAHG